MYSADKCYIQNLARGLGVRRSNDLDIIMGAEELKAILGQARQEDFLGERPWINLHTHSSASDGQLSPIQWVENAFNWMQKEHLIQYIIALTDHDTIDGLIPVLKYVVKNREKLKGLRIVLGCELSTSFESEMLRRPVDFEILHYGINPFDGSYSELLKKQAKNRHAQLQKLFENVMEKYSWLPANLKEYQSSCFYGANMQKGLGCNWLYDTMNYFRSLMPQGADLSMVFDEMSAFGFQNKEKGMWCSVQKLLNFIRKHGGFASMAHPYRLLLNQKLNVEFDKFIPFFFAELSKNGLLGTELFYGNLGGMQASFDAMINGNQPINDTDKWVKLIQDSSHAFFPLATGGSDNHDAYLGNRQYKNKEEHWEKLKNYWFEIQPLIAQGYCLLEKEVTMGLPGPCMPIYDKRCDLGIGSPYGQGAECVWHFWGKSINKILLGPAGRTTKEAKHSPYVSDDEHPNPFFIPLEYLINKRILSYSDLLCLKHSESSVTIDFDLVEENFNAMQKKISPLKLDELAKEVKQKNKYRYIADMQVQIPKMLVQKNKDLFLDGFVLGTPGDNLSSQPRNWGFPVFNPEKLFNKNGSLGAAGKLWQHIIDTAVSGAKGGLRIDHFIGLVNPYVISTDPNIPNGRLYSSYDHPILKKYAFKEQKQFYQIIERIVLPVLAKHKLTKMDLYPEDIGARPEQLDDVLDHFGLGRLIVAEFNEPETSNHIYQLMNARPYDVATLDTHDTPSIGMFFGRLGDSKRQAYAVHLARSLRFNYVDDLKSTEQLIRMQWGELLACPAKRIQAFFTSWIGQVGRYNEPGNPDKWRLRCVQNFEEVYFKNLYNGQAYNPLDAIALAIYARGDDFYQKNEAFVMQLRRSESQLKKYISEWLG